MPRTLLTPLRASLIGVIGIITCWSLATPRYAGPDEPSHAVASAALVRGDRTGPGAGFVYDSALFVVPAMVGDPNPGCFALQPDIPARCAGSPIDSTAMTTRDSTAYVYPIWGQLLPGLASFIPTSQWYLYLARSFNASLAAALVVAAIRRCRQRSSTWLLTGLFVGVTPIAWFSISVVNPSALSIAGGAALWASILTPPRRGQNVLLAASWLALALPRRDGPLWATLVVTFACIASQQGPRNLWRQLGKPSRTFLLGSLPVSLIPMYVNGYDRMTALIALVPLAIPVGEVTIKSSLARRIGRSHMKVRVGLVLAAPFAALLAANVIRPGGANFSLTVNIISDTGQHLRQIVGLLGWVDTPPPEFAVLLWWATLGGVAVLALLATPRAAAVGAAAFATELVTSWVVRLGLGYATGAGWQGRYSMPFFVGVPMLLAAGIAIEPAREPRMAVAIRGSVWVVWNAAFYAAMRRWGAGVSGNPYPWHWELWGSPGHPAIYIVLHGLASGWLLWGSDRAAATGILDGS